MNPAQRDQFELTRDLITVQRVVPKAMQPYAKARAKARARAERDAEKLLADRDELLTRKSKKKVLVSDEEKEHQEQLALHLARTAHGLVSKLADLHADAMPYGYDGKAGPPVPKPKKSPPAQWKPAKKKRTNPDVDAKISAGARYRESLRRPRRSTNGWSLEEVREGRAELYGDGAYETPHGVRPGWPR